MGVHEGLEVKPIITTFAIVAILSFIALAAPFIPLAATLLIPLIGFMATSLPLTGAWAAWAVSMITFAFHPAFIAHMKRLDTHLLQKRGHTPPSPPIYTRTR